MRRTVEPPGCPQRLARCVAMWCDAQRRVGGTLRYAEARRVAYRDVDKSYASDRLT
jgi:hypothetical protein